MEIQGPKLISICFSPVSRHKKPTLTYAHCTFKCGGQEELNLRSVRGGICILCAAGLFRATEEKVSREGIRCHQTMGSENRLAPKLICQACALAHVKEKTAPGCLSLICCLFNGLCAMRCYGDRLLGGVRGKRSGNRLSLGWCGLASVGPLTVQQLNRQPGTHC